MKKLDLNNILINELKGLSKPDYVQARIYGELQKKLNEIIDWINKQSKGK